MKHMSMPIEISFFERILIILFGELLEPVVLVTYNKDAKLSFTYILKCKARDKVYIIGEHFSAIYKDLIVKMHEHQDIEWFGSRCEVPSGTVYAVPLYNSNKIRVRDSAGNEKDFTLNEDGYFIVRFTCNNIEEAEWRL